MPNRWSVKREPSGRWGIYSHPDHLFADKVRDTHPEAIQVAYEQSVKAWALHCRLHGTRTWNPITGDHYTIPLNPPASREPSHNPHTLRELAK